MLPEQCRHAAQPVQDSARDRLGSGMVTLRCWKSRQKAHYARHSRTSPSMAWRHGGEGENFRALRQQGICDGACADVPTNCSDLATPHAAAEPRLPPDFRATSRNPILLLEESLNEG